MSDLKVSQFFYKAIQWKKPCIPKQLNYNRINNWMVENRIFKINKDFINNYINNGE